MPLFEQVKQGTFDLLTHDETFFQNVHADITNDGKGNYKYLEIKHDEYEVVDAKKGELVLKFQNPREPLQPKKYLRFDIGTTDIMQGVPARFVENKTEATRFTLNTDHKDLIVICPKESKARDFPLYNHAGNWHIGKRAEDGSTWRIVASVDPSDFIGPDKVIKSLKSGRKAGKGEKGDWGTEYIQEEIPFILERVGTSEHFYLKHKEEGQYIKNVNIPELGIGDYPPLTRTKTDIFTDDKGDAMQFFLSTMSNKVAGAHVIRTVPRHEIVLTPGSTPQFYFKLVPYTTAWHELGWKLE